MLAGLLMLAVADFAGAEEAGVPLDVDVVSALIADLGAEEFEIRETAFRRLIEFGPVVMPMLEKYDSDADPEVRGRTRRILVRLREIDRERRIVEFMQDDDPEDDHGLPGWHPFRQIVGHGKAARQLFVNMQKAEGELIYLAMNKPSRAGAAVGARAQTLYYMRQYFKEDVTDGAVAAILFVASLEGVKASSRSHSRIYSLFYRSEIKDKLSDGKDIPLRRLVIAWILNSDGVYAYQRLTLAMRYNLKETLPLAKKLATDKALRAYYRQYAILAVAKFGGRKEADFLEKLLPDNTVVYTRKRGNKVDYEVQARDVALAALLNVNGQDPGKFGFNRIQPNSQTVYQLNTMSFPNEAARKAALKKWEDFRKDQQAKAG